MRTWSLFSDGSSLTPALRSLPGFSPIKAEAEVWLVHNPVTLGHVFWEQYKTIDKATAQPTKIPVLSYYNVFNAEHIDGVEIPDAVKLEDEKDREFLRI